MVSIPGPEYRPTIPGMMQHIVALYGDAEALVREGRRMTFNQLGEASERVARALLASGLGKGSRVGLIMPPTPEYVAYMLAIGRIGGVVAPMSTLLQAPEMQWIIANAELEHLIVADTFLRHDYLARLEEALPGLAESGPAPLFLEAAPRLRSIFVTGERRRPWASDADALLLGSEAISAELLAGVEARVTPSDPFCIIHTSGSTATPKGVIHAQGPFVRHSWQAGHKTDPSGPGVRIIAPRPFFWVAGLVATLFYSLQNGTCVITVQDSSPAAVLDLITREGANALAGDSGWFDVVRDSAELRAAGYDVVRLNMDRAAIAKDGQFLCPLLAERFGTPRHVPAERIARSFGMTETLGAHTSLPWGEYLPEGMPFWQGKAIPGVDLKIVDPETRVPLPAGEVGELMVRGYCLTIGLNGRERWETFDEEGYYPTGDLCLLSPDGYLKFESRLGEMLKVHGANVSPLEVELAMLGLMGIEKVAAIGLPDGGDTTVVAGVVMGPGRELDEAAVIAALRKQISSFKVPKRIIAFADADMPMTGSGKIIKSQLVELLKGIVPVAA